MSTSFILFYANCFKLDTLDTATILATTPPDHYGRAFHTPLDTIKATILVPAESVNTYKSAEDWSEYINYIEAID